MLTSGVQKSRQIPMREALQICHMDDGENGEEEEEKEEFGDRGKGKTGKKGGSSLWLPYGKWSSDLDGGDPEVDERFLIETAIRIGRSQLGVDLSDCASGSNLRRFTMTGLSMDVFVKRHAHISCQFCAHAFHQQLLGQRW